MTSEAGEGLMTRRLCFCNDPKESRSVSDAFTMDGGCQSDYQTVKSVSKGAPGASSPTEFFFCLDRGGPRLLLTWMCGSSKMYRKCATRKVKTYRNKIQ